MKVSGLGTSATNIFVKGGVIQFSANGVAYNLTVPDATITFSPNVTSASTSFDAIFNRWNTSVPLSFSGNVFLAGLAYPVSTALPGGINPVNWTGTFYADTTGISINWQWAAAVYTAFTSSPNGIGVKPIDGNTQNPYANSDHAGTPENFKSNVIGGAGGGGGSNWTGSYSGTASVVPKVIMNQPPVANAGPNQTVFEDLTVHLDGTGSTDPDGDPLTYYWSFVSIPSGSSATLTGSGTAQPSFFADKVGNYTVQLIVSDGYVDSPPAQVVITTKNSPPVANAGPNQSVTVQTTVQLDGSRSSDVDGDPLTYQWTVISKPQNSAAVLSNPNAVRPTFVVDAQGSYTFQLVVNDGIQNSAPSNVTVTTQNSAPVANAGPSQKIAAGATVHLDGSGSTDVDGDRLTYSWSLLSVPQGSTAAISNTNTIAPTFVADLNGSYVAQLIVNDGTSSSAPATVLITTGNTPPVANAGLAQTVAVGSQVTLNGTASLDVDGDTLSFSWSIVSTPSGSHAVLTGATTPNPMFTVDLAGDYVIQLIVNDGTFGSAPATVVISTANSQPVANAGPRQNVIAGTTVTLDGSGSFDADSNALTYTWSLLALPSGSTAVLSNPHAVKPTFVADLTGQYVAQLIVNDGHVSSVPATVLITVAPAAQPPVVSAGPNQTIELPVNSLTLNGSAVSVAPAGSPVAVQWTEVSGPGTITFASPTTPITQATFPAAGKYVVQLAGTVTATGLSSSAQATITVAPVNQPPVVTVGPDQTITYPATTANLTGTATDDGLPIGSTLAISWSVLSGSGSVTFANPFQPNTQATFSQAGNYVLQLSASDGQYTAAGTLRVTYSAPASGGITVSAGTSQVIAMPNPATLNGSARDSNPPSGSTLNVSWSQVSGPGTATFANASVAATTATFSDVGVYVLRLTATNGTYTASSDTTIYAGQIQCVLSNQSTDFWLMFIAADLADTNTNPPRQLSLYISSSVATSGTVSVPGQGLNFAFTVTPGQIATVVLPQSVQVTTSDTVESKGIHVTSQNPIAVYGLNFVPAASDGFMALPTTTLGTSYINLGYNNTTSGIPDVPSALGTEFGITAAQDGTTVTIVPSANAGARGARQAYTVSLNQGQTYQLFNNRDLTTFTNSGSLVDLTGSIITSDKPVAVFGGNACAFVPNNNAFCNHLVEQLPPTNLWGQHFVSYPITQNQNGDRYRFLAQTDNTHLQLNGQQVAQINRAEFYETVVKGPAQIDADQPILVAQYSNSSTFSGTTNADPTMILIPPFEEFGGGYTVNTPTSNFPTNVINLVAATSAAQAGSITLDGTAVPGSAFQPIGTSPFSGTQINATLGPHTFAGPLPFGIYAYGFNTYDAYGYSGGVCFAKGMTGSTLVASPKTTNAPVTSQVCIQAKVTDSSGNPIGGTGVTFKVAGVNSTTGFVTTDATGTATFCYRSFVTGSDLVTITAGKASDTASITWVSNGPNQPPVVSAGPNLTISLPTNSAFLNGSVTDDGLPVGGTLTQMWSKVSGPAGVSFTTPTQPQTSVTFPQAGTYVLQLTASDSQLTSSATATVIVYPPNQPPVVSAGPDQSLMWFGAQGTYLSGTVTDDGLPTGSTLTINWTTISGPSPISFSSPNSAVTFAQFPYPGTYVAQLSANDTQFTTTSFVTIHAYGPVTTNLTSSSSLAIDAGTSGSLDAGVLVGGQPPAPGIPLKIQWGVFAGPSGGQVTFGSPNTSATSAVFSAPGTYQVILNLSDANRNNIGATPCCLTVNVAPAGTQAPTVSLVTPTDGSEITATTNVIGNVSDGNWTLEYSVANDLTPQPFVTIATGTGAVTNASVGTLDPTLLLNGTYTIRLRSTNASGLTGAAAVTVNVTRNMKIGVFTLSFNDVTVPLPGLPVQVIRTYDSRDKSIGDFGVGWHMSIANLRVQKNHNLGLAWQETVTFPGQIPLYCLQPTIPTIVTITFPDGKVYRFQTTTAQTCQPAGPISADTLTFTQIPTSSNTAGASLVPQDGGAVLVDGSIPGPVHLDGYDGNTYNPTQFKLTTADGTIYLIDQRLGATSVRNTNGNVVTIMPSAITHSTGRGIVVDRDIQGRVTRINDPNGNSMYYAYDQNGNLVTYTDRQSNLTAYTYDGSHNLTGITLPNGTSGLANTYDPSGRLSATKDALGFSTGFAANLTAQTETITDRSGYGTIYAYDADGNVVKTTDPFGNFSSATYDSADNKLTETNKLGKTTTYRYDSFGNKLTESDPLQHQTSYTYSPLQRVLTVTDANQHTTTNTYDGNGNLLTTTDANQKTTTNTYGPSGVLATTKDPLGNTTKFVYDGNGNLTQQTDALNNVSTYTYDSNGNRTSQSVTRTLPAAQGGGKQTLTTQYQYDGLNRLVKTIYPDGAAAQVVYNNLGQQTATIDALGHQTSYTYDADGRLTQTNYPDSAFESSVYDNNGNRIRFTPRAGNATLYTYDALNRLTQSQVGSNPSSAAITTTVYDAAGQVTSTKDPDGNVTQYFYDDAGRRTKVINALNQITGYGYDAAGNQTSMTDALTHTTTYVYDPVNRRTQVIYPDSTSESTGYDVLGRVTSRTDANGKITQYAYDPLGRLTSVTDALNQVTSYAYDEVGNRLTQTDANTHTTSYQYDQRGRRTLRALPGGQTEKYVYDANGNMSSKTDFNGRTTTYTYDSMNRLLSKTADPYFAQNQIGASSVSFGYTASGKRSFMSDASGSSSYRYDSFDRLSQIFNPEGSASYVYDLAGNLTTIGGPGGANYFYDGLNRLGAVQWQVGNNRIQASYGYDAAGNLQSVTYPNGVVHNYSYNVKNQLTNLAVNNSSGAIASYAYTVDAGGHRTQVTELGGRTVQYGYDSLYRLTSETISGASSQNGAIGYVYDSVGNRQSMSSTVPAIPAGTFFYDANDRRTSDVYDAEGNTIGSGGLNYVYDFENHLVQQGGASFVYDGDGNRVQKIVAGNVTHYFVDSVNPSGFAQVLAEETASNFAFTNYTWGLDLISRVDFSSGQPIYFVHDGHGSVRALTNPSGAVTDTYDYDAFGNLLHSTGSTANNYLFAGEQFDPNLNLYYNRARYLSTNTGRFWSMDTYEGRPKEPATLDKYTYTGSDPVNRTDPTGNDFDIATSLDSIASISAATFLFAPPSQSSDDEQLPEKGAQLNSNYNAIDLFTSKSDDEVFDKYVRTFDGVNAGDVASVTGVPVNSVGQKLTFTLHGLVSYGQTPFSVRVKRFDSGAHTISAVTLSGHPLSGWRYWRVFSQGQGHLVVETGAVDTPGPGWYNRFKYEHSRSTQLLIWEEELKYIQKQLGARQGSYDFVQGQWGSDQSYILRNVCQSSSCY